MPVEFSQPGAYDPSVSSAYGAAQQFSQDLPYLQKLQFAQADQQQHAASLQQHAALQAAGLASQQGEFGAQMAYRYAAMDQQQGLQSQAEAHAAAQAQQGAALNSWLGQQDLTQKETMRLQQQRNIIGDASAAHDRGELNDEQYQGVLARVYGTVTPLEARLQAAKVRDTEAQAKMRQMQTVEEEGKVQLRAKIAAASLDDQRQVRVDPDAQAELEALVPPVPPEAVAAGLGPVLEAKRQATIKAMAQRAGRTSEYLMTKDGTFERQKPDPQAKPPAPPKPFDVSKAMKDAQAEAHAARPDDQFDASTKKPYASQDRLDDRHEYAIRVFERIRAEHDAVQQATPSQGRGFGAVPPQPFGRPAVPPPGEAVGTPSPKTPTHEQAADIMDDFNKRLVPPEMKGVVNAAYRQAKDLIDAHGGYDKLNVTQKAIVDHNQSLIRRALLKAKSLPLDPGQQPAPAAPPDPSTLPRHGGEVNPYGGVPSY